MYTVVSSFVADVDECKDDKSSNCHTNATCMNTGGNYFCECTAGYQGDGVICTGNGYVSHRTEVFLPCGSLKLESVLTFLIHFPPDLNECEDFNDCDIHATCNNTDGSYFCECSRGFVGDGWSCKGKRNPSAIMYDQYSVQLGRQ